MENIDILLWVMGTGFSLIFGLLLVIWHNMNERFSQVDSRIDKLDEKITDVDRRLCRLEGAFSSKEFCALKSDRNLKAAEGG